VANVNVTYEDMNASGQQLINGRVEIETLLSNLQKAVDTLVNGGYVTDSSSKQFQASYDEFNTGVKQTIAGLDGMGTYLQKAASTFQDADTQLAQALNS
jgi:WXG100 family type VII secretion target